MINQQLAEILNEIADFLEADRVAFKPFAYRKAAQILEGLEKDAAEIYQIGGLKALEEIPGIGKSIAQKIEEYIKTGHIKYFDELKRRLPVNLEEITAIEGIGPKKAKILYQKLGVKTLDDLERAAITHQIAPLAHFGQRSEENILQGINFQRRSHGRFLLGDILPQAREILEKIKKFEKVNHADLVGSLRRRKETIGDIDILAILTPKADKNAASNLMDYFTSFEGIEKIWGKGLTKASVRMRQGFDMDLRILPPQSYGAALQYFTGSKEHNIALRRLAIEKGLKLSEYGLFKGAKMLASASEEDIYRQLGLCFIPPEIRENEGEIQAAAANELPKLVSYNSLKGDLHCHSDWDGGSNSIEEIALAAIKKGYEYVGIADHTKYLRIEHGLDEKKLVKRNQQIDQINEKFRQQGKNFVILKGCEANILDNGEIDIDSKTLAELDFVIAGIHSNMKMTKDKMTSRILKAIENPNIDIISHPTGRLVKKRDEYAVDLEKIFAGAKKTGTILEINSNPARLDLKDSYIRRAKDYGIKFCINSDTHIIDNLNFAEFGIAQARRGWAEAADIINTYPLDKMLKFIKQQV